MLDDVQLWGRLLLTLAIPNSLSRVTYPIPGQCRWDTHSTKQATSATNDRHAFGPIYVPHHHVLRITHPRAPEGHPRSFSCSTGCAHSSLALLPPLSPLPIDVLLASSQCHLNPRASSQPLVHPSNNIPKPAMLIPQPQQLLPRHPLIVTPSPLLLHVIQLLRLHIPPVRMRIADRIALLIIAPVHPHD